MSESPWAAILPSKNRYRLIFPTTSLPSWERLFPTRPSPDQLRPMLSFLSPAKEVGRLKQLLATQIISQPPDSVPLI